MKKSHILVGQLQVLAQTSAAAAQTAQLEETLG